LFGFETSPNDFTSNTPTIEELKKLLRDQPTQLKEVYGPRLEEEFPPTELGKNTIFDEGMLLQETLDLKMCM
jgi:hypothetical protein